MTKFSYWIQPSGKITAILDFFSGLTKFSLGPFWTKEEAVRFLNKWR